MHLLVQMNDVLKPVLAVDERDTICCLSGHVPRYPSSGEVASAHILDQIFCTPFQRYDAANQIWMKSDLHRIWDNREFNIIGDGRVVWTRQISSEELAKLGLNHESRLNPCLLTKERIAYLNQREQHYGSFRIKSDLASANEKELKDASKKRGLPFQAGDSNRA